MDEVGVFAVVGPEVWVDVGWGDVLGEEVVEVVVIAVLDLIHEFVEGV